MQKAQAINTLIKRGTDEKKIKIKYTKTFKKKLWICKLDFLIINNKTNQVLILKLKQNVYLIVF